MTLPDVIKYTSSNGNPPDGLINAIKTVYGIENPLTAEIIKLDKSSTYKGNIETVVLWNSGWRTNTEVDSYVQLQFPKRFVFLSGYSLKGSGGFYSKKWRVEGFNQGEENDKSKWILLARNTSTERGFCGNEGSNCGSYSFVTYCVNLLNKGFQYIRWTGESSSNDGSSSCRFSVGGIELYGTLSTVNSLAKRKTRNFCTYRACLIYVSSSFVLFTYIFVAIK